MKYRLLLLSAVVAVAGCVSNKAVQTIQAGDDEKSCDTLQTELIELGVRFEEAKDESGVTGKNAGLLILFWPGIIVNEVRANKNQDSIDDRVSYLTNIYNEKCSTEIQNSKNGQTLTEELLELRELHDQGLINAEEYERARQKALDNE